ncbi:MAG: beta-ketoacyl-[acyl-carrier-protein] synthase family protein [Verrucomicrobiota bacterium]
MKRAVITGLGLITSIGNDYASVLKSLKETRSGIELFDEFSGENIPVKLAGTIKEFSFPSAYFEDWEFPKKYALSREHLRPMAPNTLYAYCAMQQAIEDAKLTPDLFSNHAKTSLMCASGGSMWMAYENLHTMETQGVQRTQPMGIINSIPGSLYINLGAIFKIQGGTLGFSSACSSSAHAMGAAYDLITQGKQERVFVAGAEDCNRFSILPFAAVRALSPQKDPKNAPRAFDKNRDGFVGTGGGCVLVVEELEIARARGAKIYAEMIGWGQTSDGFNVLAPETNGEGLARCIQLALEHAKTKPKEVDYINAHATSTSVGDTAEIRAIKKAFPAKHRPLMSSTKSLTGHGLSLAGAMEAAFCCMNIKEAFVPVSANITELDPECDGVPIIERPISHQPRVVMSNSSGFGGTNVSIVFRKFEG